MTRRLLPLLATLLALAAAGCSEKDEPAADGGGLEEFTVILDYFPNADHAPLYAALASGEYERAGLDVELVAPADPAAPLRLLAGGRADVALTYPPELLLARQEGTAVVGVGALVQKPLTSLMAMEGSGVRSVQDLRGKVVGTAGIPYQEAYLRTILERAGIPEDEVQQVDVGFNLVPAMLAERVDATLGAFWNYEGTDLRLRGRSPTVLRMEQLGVPTYNELVFAARRTSLTPDQASRLRRFFQATARGAAQVRDAPEEALDALLQANDDLEEELQRAVIEVTAPLFFPEDEDRPFGFQDLGEWEEYGRWMQRSGLVEEDPGGEDAVTNEFLPGQGLDANTAEPVER
jgi:putative hydroxymethylpyrimidine transport system substrate-binding protein